jgi:hypothetical protein
VKALTADLLKAALQVEDVRDMIDGPRLRGHRLRPRGGTQGAGPHKDAQGPGCAQILQDALQVGA